MDGRRQTRNRSNKAGPSGAQQESARSEDVISNRLGVLAKSRLTFRSISFSPKQRQVSHQVSAPRSPSR